jgi:hypothetical protein
LGPLIDIIVFLRQANLKFENAIGKGTSAYKNNSVKVS